MSDRLSGPRVLVGVRNGKVVIGSTNVTAPYTRKLSQDTSIVIEPVAERDGAQMAVLVGDKAHYRELLPGEGTYFYEVGRNGIASISRGVYFEDVGYGSYDSEYSIQVNKDHEEIFHPWGEAIELNVWHPLPWGKCFRIFERPIKPSDYVGRVVFLEVEENESIEINFRSGQRVVLSPASARIVDFDCSRPSAQSSSAIHCLR